MRCGPGNRGLRPFRAGWDAPTDKGDDVVPKPEGVFGRDEASTPRYGRASSAGCPESRRRLTGSHYFGCSPAVGAGLLPPPSPSRKEVSLTSIEECSGWAHAKHLNEASQDTKSTNYQTMHNRLTGLDYPASRIHRMPNHAGAPRARFDLCSMRPLGVLPP